VCAASRWGFSSRRDAASGCAPDRAVTFSCLPKRKSPKRRAPSSPVGLGPTALRCSVFAARAELATRPAGAALRQLREVSLRGALARPAAKPCAARRLRRGPRAIRRSLREHSIHASLRIGSGLAPGGEWLRYLSPNGGGCSSACAHHYPFGLRYRSLARKQARHPAVAQRAESGVRPPPSDELSSTGLCGARFSAHQQLTSGSCLNAAATGRVVSSARPAKSEQRKAALAQRGPRRQGRFLWFLSLSTQRKELGRRAETPTRPHAVNKNHHANSATRLRSAKRTLS
jgi:hypothetical protein